MKEITFEEMIDEYSFEVDEIDVKYCYAGGVLELLQQVREATIAECVEILRNPNIPKTRMEALPTDRIKIKE